MAWVALTDAQIESMGAADLRAVAHDRGYDIGEAGARESRRRFRAVQSADKTLKEAPKESPGRDPNQAYKDKIAAKAAAVAAAEVKK